MSTAAGGSANTVATFNGTSNILFGDTLDIFPAHYGPPSTLGRPRHARRLQAAAGVKEETRSLTYDVDLEDYH